MFYACHHQFASETISCKIQVIKIGHDHLQIICLGMMTKHFQVKKKNMTKNYVTYDSVVNTRKPFINSMTGNILFDISRIQYNSFMMFIWCKTITIIMYDFCSKTHSNINKQNAANVFYLGKEKSAFCIYKLYVNRN